MLRSRTADGASSYSFTGSPIVCLGGIKYASIFHDLGFDCVLYDQRNHGRSDKAITTMGVCESRDLAAVCDWVREKFGEAIVLGTHGESMGAATVMLHSALDGRLAFAMEDCGYSNFSKELRYALRVRFHLPVYPILPIASLFYKLRGGEFFGRISPRRRAETSGQYPDAFHTRGFGRTGAVCHATGEL